MDGDPFRALSIAYDAGPDEVRRAFRRLAHETHPDRGGDVRGFQAVHRAYTALMADLEGERRRWRPPPRRPAGPGGLDPGAFPTCRVIVRGTRDGRREVTYDIAARPPGWTPGAAPPPGGACRQSVPADGASPAFGVWVVPLGAERYRCVFGPPG